ncbi:MAG TPA: amidase [Dehalococcoidia bacterium]|nr:amidase [Dehalococcoidia bacterium]
MKLDDVILQPAIELSRLLTSGDLSSVQLTQAYIHRANKYQRLNAYVTLDEEGALAQAEAADRKLKDGDKHGTLLGLPVAVKDQLDVRGLRTTAGSKLVDYIADEDATAVARLREAGAVILGKLNMSEFALGGNITHAYGVPHNPWDEIRQAGQSSSGSGIAVSASLCAAALGGDTAGSIRGPAAWCGITGLRPTWGRVSRRGTWPLAWFFDTIGPMTKTVADCAMVFEAIAGHDLLEPNSSSRPVEHFVPGDDLQGLRLGLVRESVDDGACTEEVAQGVRDALEVLKEAGVSVTEVSLPLFPHGGMICGGLSDAEAAFVHRHRLRERPQDFDFASRRRLMYGSLITGAEYAKLSRLRMCMRQDIMNLLGQVDALVTPTQAEVAPRLQTSTGLTSKEAVLRQFFGSRAHRGTFSLAGVPGLSVPVGFSKDGLPLSVQLVGRPYEENLLFRIGHAYQERTHHHEARPSLS